LSLFEESLRLRCVLVGEGVIWGYPLRDYCALLWYDVGMKAVRKSECSPIVEGDGIIFFQHLIMNLLDWRLRQWVAEAVRGREAVVTFYAVASTTTAGTRHRQRYGKSSRCGYWHRKLLLVKCCCIGVKWSLWKKASYLCLVFMALLYLLWLVSYNMFHIRMTLNCPFSLLKSEQPNCYWFHFAGVLCPGGCCLLQREYNLFTDFKSTSLVQFNWQLIYINIRGRLLHKLQNQSLVKLNT
jgi:hypothetical protein